MGVDVAFSVLLQVNILNCPQVAVHNVTYYLEVVLKQPKPCLKKLCCTSCADSSDQVQD